MPQDTREVIKLVTPHDVDAVVAALDEQITKSNDPYVKKLLLQTSCQIIDHVLSSHDASYSRAA